MDRNILWVSLESHGNREIKMDSQYGWIGLELFIALNKSPWNFPLTNQTFTEVGEIRVGEKKRNLVQLNNWLVYFYFNLVQCTSQYIALNYFVLWSHIRQLNLNV